MLSRSSQGESSVLRVRLRVVKDPLQIRTSLLRVIKNPLQIHISRSQYALAEVE